MSAPVLELSHIDKTFGARKVVDDVSFAAGPGEVVCLLGASGSGKSTTLRILAGIEQADAGTVTIGGAVVDGPGLFVAPEKRGIGLVFQDLALFPHLTARANAAFGLFRLPRRKALERADAVLAAMGLSRLARHYPHKLSGGEQQRLAVARALAIQPAVMLLDEPFSGLDDRLRDGVRSEVIGVLRRQQAATVLVTHDPDEALRCADSIVLLRDGRVVQQGTPDDLFRRPADLGAAAFFSPLTTLKSRSAAGRAETPLGTVATAGLAENAPVTVALRPRDIERAHGDGMDLRIRSHSTASDGCHVECEPAPGLAEGLVAVLPDAGGVTVGETIRLRVRPGAGLVFAA